MANEKVIQNQQQMNIKELAMLKIKQQVYKARKAKFLERIKMLGKVPKI